QVWSTSPFSTSRWSLILPSPNLVTVSYQPSPLFFTDFMFTIAHKGQFSPSAKNSNTLFAGASISTLFVTDLAIPIDISLLIEYSLLGNHIQGKRNLMPSNVSNL